MVHHPGLLRKWLEKYPTYGKSLVNVKSWTILFSPFQNFFLSFQKVSVCLCLCLCACLYGMCRYPWSTEAGIGSPRAVTTRIISSLMWALGTKLRSSTRVVCSAYSLSLLLIHLPSPYFSVSTMITTISPSCKGHFAIENVNRLEYHRNLIEQKLKHRHENKPILCRTPHATDQLMETLTPSVAVAQQI